MATSFQDDFMKTALRLPRDLHTRLMESARNKGRSFNSELVARLAESLEADKGLTPELAQKLGMWIEQAARARANEMVQWKEVEAFEPTEEGLREYGRVEAPKRPKKP